jgi:phage gp36-like protein
MAYSTQALVQNAVGGPEKLLQLTDLANANAPTIDAAVVAQAIAEADSVIDSYVGHRFAVPLSPIPPVVRDLSTAWTARVLRRNKYNGQVLQDDIDREVVDRKWLEGVAKGVISLGIEPTPAKASMINDKAGQRSPLLVVSRQRLRGIW